jgi:hypothetical protein
MEESWSCTNVNGDVVLNEMKNNVNPCSVYWIERNTIYHNKSCNADKVENPYRVPEINRLMLLAIEYMNKQNIKVVYPSINLIE